MKKFGAVIKKGAADGGRNNTEIKECQNEMNKKVSIGKICTKDWMQKRGEKMGIKPIELAKWHTNYIYIYIYPGGGICAIWVSTKEYFYEN